MHFYEIHGVLLRRWMPNQRRLAMEVWMGDGWAPYANVEHVLRYGRRVSGADALALLQDKRASIGARPFVGEEARVALRDRRRRSGSSAHR